MKEQITKSEQFILHSTMNADAEYLETTTDSYSTIAKNYELKLKFVVTAQNVKSGYDAVGLREKPKTKKITKHLRPGIASKMNNQLRKDVETAIRGVLSIVRWIEEDDEDVIPVVNVMKLEEVITRGAGKVPPEPDKPKEVHGSRHPY
ncbi:hypothetical protein OAG36_00760 [bacterium]|nr:hypothetical protein [bacterium]